MTATPTSNNYELEAPAAAWRLGVDEVDEAYLVRFVGTDDLVEEEEEDEANPFCDDCGVATVSCAAPPFTPCSKPVYGCDHDGTWEWYMVTDHVWALAGDALFLCIGDLERRLGRPLNSGDFAALPVNDPNPYDTPRLAAAKARPVSVEVPA